ncbi:MAG: hypothetical protein Q8P89_02175 [bacterium]|nr:hypothetical protein [bacterium]
MNHDVAEIKGFLRGLLWGILLAIGALIFFETEKGQKIKGRIKEKGEGFLDDLPGLLEELEEKGEKWFKEAAEFKEEATEKAEEKIDESLGHIAALQEHGREISSKIKTRFFKNTPRKHLPSEVN